MLRGNNKFTKILLILIVVFFALFVLPSAFGLRVSNVKGQDKRNRENSLVYYIHKNSYKINNKVAYRLKSMEEPEVVKVVDINKDSYEVENKQGEHFYIINDVIVGKTVIVIPFAGYILELLKTPMGMLLNVLIVTAMIALSILTDISEQKDQYSDINSDLDIVIIEKLKAYRRSVAKKMGHFRLRQS